MSTFHDISWLDEPIRNMEVSQINKIINFLGKIFYAHDFVLLYPINVTDSYDTITSIIY